MFSLIITIISIALVAALAVASVYYGGSAFTNGSAKANASTVVNQAQQISAAWAMFQNDNAGANPASVADLVTGNYLQATPNAPAAVSSSAYALNTPSGATPYISLALASTASNVCAQIHQSGTGSSTLASAVSTTAPYDCFNPSTGVYTFQYNQ